MNQHEQEFLALLNQYRRQVGAPAVEVDARLARAALAKVHCFQLTGIEPVVHTCNRETSEALRRRFEYTARGTEIVAWSERTAVEVFNAWRTSPVHDAVMRDAQYRAVGIAGPIDAGRFYGTWVVEFGVEPPSKQPAPESGATTSGKVAMVAKSLFEIPAPFRTAGKITRDTPIRLVGDAPKNVIRGVLEYANSPAMAEFDSVYEAIGGHSVALTAIMAKETEYGRTHNAAKNGWNTIDGTPGFTPYDSWQKSAEAAMRRFADFTYKDGIYEPEITVAAFHQVWQGGPECRRTNYGTCANGEDRDSIELAILQFCDRANRIIRASAVAIPPTPTAPPVVTPQPGGKLVFGRVPLPKNYRENILPPDKNVAYGKFGKRIIRALIYHRMLGSLDGTDGFFQSWAPYPHGAACCALTDFGIGNGRVVQWNALNSDYAPHASGPANGVKGDAVAFLQNFGGSIGVNVFNRDGASLEVAGMQNDPIDSETYKRIVETSAYVADRFIQAPYDTWPVVDGLVRTFWHDEVTNDKSCPFKVIKELTASIIADTAAYMKPYQLSA